MKGLRFYDALPKHKAELVDGRFIIGGSLEKSAMMLGYMVENLGAEYVADLVPKDVLQEAVIEVYGRKNTAGPMADFTPVKPFHSRVQKLAFDLQYSLYKTKGLTVFGGKMAIKLGEDVFMPDVYIIRNEECHRLNQSYLEGAPDLIMEVVTPYMRDFDFGVRLDKYAKAGLPEVWMIDYADRSFTPMVLKDGHFQSVPVISPLHASVSIPELKIEHSRIFESAEEFGVSDLDIFTIEPAVQSEKTQSTKPGLEWHSVPFAPRVALDPVEITFAEYISWGGEVKFEMMDGVPIFGGSEETTKEWLGLLLMTLGMKEAVKYLPGEAWAGVL